MPNDDEQCLFILQGGNYKLLEQVGEGGMGVVYRGIDNLMRGVAVKEFSPSQPERLSSSLLEELKEAFYREARLLANLEHPSLPKVYGYFTEADKLYLVMEFIEGDNLKRQAEELKQKFDGQFSIKKVRQWAKDLLDVLIYLHERDSPIFHRDIKPENLKVRNGRICLLDFGLARGSAGNMSAVATRTLFGFTLKYAPVEQRRGEKTTAQTDLYALAATLYYLLTGEEPADSLFRDREVKENRPDPLQPVKELRLEVDDKFAEVIMQALSIEAQHRPSSARAMWEKMEARSYSTSPISFHIPTHVLNALSPNPPPNPLPPAPSPMPQTIPVAPPSYPLPTPAPPPVKPSPSSKKLLVVLACGAVLCLLAAVAIFLALPKTEPNPSPSNTDSQSSSSSVGKKLSADRDLYERPNSQAKIIGSLSKGTEVQVGDEFERDEVVGANYYRFHWFEVKVLNSTVEGWVKCAGCKEP